MYFLTFIEGGNSWFNYYNYSAFRLKKSLGIGFRILVPIVGIFGIDWSYGFDNNFFDYSGLIYSIYVW